MMPWFGYLHVDSGGSYTVSTSNGQGSICVPDTGYVVFGVDPVTISLPEEGDYPLNLTDGTSGFSSSGGKLVEKSSATS